MNHKGSKEGWFTLVWGIWGQRCGENPAECHNPFVVVSSASFGLQIASGAIYSFKRYLHLHGYDLFELSSEAL